MRWSPARRNLLQSEICFDRTVYAQSVCTYSHLKPTILCLYMEVASIFKMKSIRRNEFIQFYERHFAHFLLLKFYYMIKASLLYEYVFANFLISAPLG